MGSLFPHLNAIVLCGQTGNELWPLVRRQAPRETVNLPGEDGSLLSATIERLKPYAEHFVFVCPQEIASQIGSAVALSGLLRKKDYELIAEPCPRGTAFSIALASALLRRRDPGAYIVATPSHLKIGADDRWEQALSRAYRAAAQDLVALLGVPSRPSSTEHSFVRPARELKGIIGAHGVSAYMPNPSPFQTARYIQLGLLWSTGVVMARASTALAQLNYVARHSALPDYRDLDRVAETAGFLATIEQESWFSEDAKHLVSSLPEASFEEAVLSASDSTAVIPATFEFSAVTSLRSVDDMAEPDELENRIIGRGFAIDSENTTIYDDDRLTVTLGCENLLVVNTRDSVLIANKDALDDLDEVVPELVAAGAAEVERSSVAEHGWGTATTLYENQACSVKLLRLLPGRAVPEYSRRGSHESWQVLEGTVEYTDGDDALELAAGQAISFKPRERHGFRNPGSATAVLMCTEFAE